MSTYSEAAVDFLRLAATVNVREAFRKYAGQTFRHHNPFFQGDAESLLTAMRNNAAKTPTKSSTSNTSSSKTTSSPSTHTCA